VLRKSHQVGFTLIELLVVISIVSLLISILLPALAKARQSAVMIECGNRLRQAGIGFSVYLTENDEWVPRMRYHAQTGFDPVWFEGSGVTVAPSFEDIWPEAVRLCPTYTAPNWNTSLTTWQWTYTAPLLQNEYAAGYVGFADPFMEGRISGDYVRLTAGPAIYRGSQYFHHNNGKSFDPTASHPLLSDWHMGSNHGVPVRVAAHSPGEAFVRETGFRVIDSTGGNTLWLDGHVEWHRWPGADVEWAEVLPDVAYYPRDVGPGAGYDDGWTRNGNTYMYYYFWMKVAAR